MPEVPGSIWGGDVHFPFSLARKNFNDSEKKLIVAKMASTVYKKETGLA